ncbi:hypothetical protein BE221DRAFT_147019 [Ostreococcus tauri]|uniref:Uncharacterized protein n=1 Tax=Ostreococcus tauri TaxID=70448 RepID=A0A1Y5IAX7_OSTTA|nr:hypothetical protein BE221DRAFT_147019 [Ostreococcus tauri]
MTRLCELHYQALRRAYALKFQSLVSLETFPDTLHANRLETAIVLTLSGDERLDELHRVAFESLRSNIGTFKLVVVQEGSSREWLKNSTRLEWVVHASPVDERKAYGRAFDRFSGIYGASVKPAAIRWLSNSLYSRAWIIEPDTVFTGKWSELFGKYADDRSDLIAYNVTFRFQNRTSWNHWHGCTLCGGLADWKKQASLLPAFRITRTLAEALVLHLRTTKMSGHHEAVLPTFVTANAEHFSWCDLAPDVEYFRWRPVWDASRLALPNSLYHPVKSPASFRRISPSFSLS